MLRPFWRVFAVPEKATDEERDKIAKTFSPVYPLFKDGPPTLIIHGDAHTLFSIQQSQRVMAKLGEAKVPHKLIVREGTGHGWPGMETDFPLLADWFAEYLGKK